MNGMDAMESVVYDNKKSVPNGDMDLGHVVLRVPDQ
jgi:hypothetical protein